jgi:hypothetical protein
VEDLNRKYIGKMAELTSADIYSLGKAGSWNKVKNIFQHNEKLAGLSVRHVKISSGWSLLHQAVYWGDSDAVAKCLKYGADLSLVGKDSKTPGRVAFDRGFFELSERMESSILNSVWKPVTDSTLRACSNRWSQKRRRIAAKDFLVGYGGGVVEIKKGEEHYVDDWGRVLVGWHGSTNPPRDMDGDNVFEN